MSSNPNIRQALGSAEKKLLLRFMALLLFCLLLVELAVGMLFFYDLYRSESKILSSMASEYQRILRFDSAQRLVHVLEANPERLIDNNITAFVTKPNDPSSAKFVAGDSHLSVDMSTMPHLNSGSWISRFILNPYLALRIGDDTQDFWLVLDNQKRYVIAFENWLTTVYAMVVMVLITSIFTQRIIRNSMIPLVTLGNLLEKLQQGKLDVIQPSEAPQGLSLVSATVQDTIASLHHTTTVLNTTVDAIAHDVRTPLSRIILSSQTSLINEDGSEKMKEALAYCAEHAMQASNMLTTLMKLNDELVGKREIQKVTTNVGEVVKNVLSWFEDVADQKNIEFTAEPKEEIVIKSDPDKLTQVLVNLVDNAIKYTPEGGQISVNVEQCESEGAIIHVIDSGIGIDPKFQTLIFERLYRIDTSRSNTEGYGLGLSIAVAMIENLGGKIEVTSRLGEGSRFSIFL
ncbi:sensor histidine kinase [Vibrio hepatarius]|uniref:sensor histidine kinase n=1 Tax=Vibrio hepatarius TaxID=171383 RepID=UPI001C0A4742|nr:HAMP domain-containing sensor histidine kinase [Vibrio hepatarius]MBU2898626.1 HAMP domain-containing histidine kinase [Vibrio hepatarius]